MTEKKASMLVRKLIEQTQTFDGELTIENVVINEKTCKLKVSNGIIPHTNRGYLHLTFGYRDANGKPGEYRISIDERGIGFRKGVYDEGDMDSTEGIKHTTLMVNTSGKDKGKLSWSKYSPRDDEDYFKVEFEGKK